tara:strand:+ start:123 stop:323 length:201 start_codon:yes stop_codon:yes gene_type:complete
MKYIRRKITEKPTQSIRMAYIIVDTSDWNDTLENHPKIVNQSGLYEITDEAIPTDLHLWSIEYEGN